MDNLTRVYDFQDFNYERIAFDINFLTDEVRKALKEKLNHDYVNHLYRFKDACYFAIWNCDFQDFKTVDDIFFDSDGDTYDLARLRLIDGKFYYQIVEERKVQEGLLM